MRTSGKTSLIVAAVLLALAAPVGLTAYVTRDKAGDSAKTPGASTLTYGDGRAAEAHDLRLTNIQVPPVKTSGTVSVEILDQAGQPVTAMVQERTKLVHLYVVRTDMTAFQHLHPSLANGTWSAAAALPATGSYRVIAEFTVDAGNHNDHVILGGEVIVPGPAQSAPTMGPDDEAVTVALEGADDAVESGKLRVHVADRAGRPVRLETYLGARAHITGFHGPTGSMVHLQPMGKATHENDATVLDARAELKLKGPYAFFVQVRVKGELHTLRVVANIQ